MHHPDPIPVSTTNYLRRQADREAAIDEAYDSLSAGLLHALLTDPETEVQPTYAFPETAGGIIMEARFHTTLGDALGRVIVEMLMEQYRAGDPRALWAVDTIVHEHADFHASDVAAESRE